jgi:ADP-L-glycero-D-manno-heptose 6-epimerase
MFLRYRKKYDYCYRSCGFYRQVTFVPTPDQFRKSYQYFTEADLSKLRAAGCNYKFAALEHSVKDYISCSLQKEDPYV